MSEPGSTAPHHRWQELFEELKRRRVIRVGTLYFLVFWPIIQIVDIASAAIGLPDSAMRYLVLAFFGGLPVVLTLAWLFDLNRGGLVRDSGADDGGEALIGSRFELGLIGVLVLVVAGLFYVQFTMQEDSAVVAEPGSTEEMRAMPAEDRSIAVLPFETFSADARDRFFADGLSEELLNVLSGLSQLEVAARTSSFAYRGTRKTVPVIGQELGVNYVLEGSVRRNDVDDLIRVTAQLIDARSGAHVWSNTFDRPFSDVFAIQDEIAGAVVNALKLTLLGNEAKEIRTHDSASPEAMIAYSMGQSELAKRTKTGMQDGERFFRRALEYDPNYAEALLGLADANTLQVAYGYEDRDQGLVEAQEAVDRALALEPELGMAWASQGLIHTERREKEQAKEALSRAIELAPSYAMAHMWYAGLLDDPDESFRHYEKAYRLDPRSPVAGFNVASQYIQRGREAEAMQVFGNIIEADPNYARAYHLAATVSENRGRYADAIRQLETAYELNPDADTAYRLAKINNLLGNFGTSDEWIARAKPLEPRERLFLYDLIELERYAIKGDMDGAKAVAVRLSEPGDDLFSSQVAAAMASYFIGDYERSVSYWESLRTGKQASIMIDMGDGTDVMVSVAFAYEQLGNEAEAEKLLGEARSRVTEQLDNGRKDAGLWYLLAQIDAMEGNDQMALINLQRAANEGWRDYWLPSLDPAFESIRKTRELQTMMAGIETQMDLMRDQFAFERSFATVPARSLEGG